MVTFRLRRMNAAPICACLLSMIAATAGARAEDALAAPTTPARFDRQTLNALHEKIEVFRVENKIPSIAIAIVHGGEIVMEKGYGSRRLGDDAMPANARTQYCVGSVSKALTAAGLMTLVERGLVDLDKPVNDYLGDTPLRSTVGDANAVTVRQVANHTAGLMRYVHFVNEKDPLGVPALADQIAQYGVMTNPPGEQWIYSNLGWGVMARIIELQSGKPYAEFMQEEIYGPLGMRRTSVGPLPGDRNVAIKYSGDEGKEEQRVPDYAALPLATGQVYTSAHDLALYGLFNLKEKRRGARAPLSDATIDEMHRPTFYTAKYIGKGVAWASAEDEQGELLVVEHDGGGNGMRAELQIYPQEDMAIAVLVNSDTRQFQGIRRMILDAVKPGYSEYLDALYEVPLENERAGAEKSAPSAEEQQAGWLAAAKRLAGDWDAKIGGPLGENTVNLTITASGDVLVGFDNQGFPALMVRGSRSGDHLAGLSLGITDPEFEWRNAPHVAIFELNLKESKIEGAMRFQSYIDLDEAPYYSAFTLPYWVEFARRGQE